MGNFFTVEFLFHIFISMFVTNFCKNIGICTVFRCERGEKEEGGQKSRKIAYVFYERSLKEKRSNEKIKSKRFQNN
jgi:hypothetical protein